MGSQKPALAAHGRLLVVGLAVAAAAGLTTLWATAETRAPESQAVSTDLRPAVAVLERTELRRLSALVSADAEALERVHAADFELVAPPGSELGRDELLGLVGSGELDFLELRPVSPIEVRLHGGSASVWYRSKIDVVSASLGRFTHETWHFCLYELRGGQWQVVREQATAVGGFPPSG